MAEKKMQHSQRKAEVVYNYLGQEVTLSDLKLKSDEYGDVMPDGRIVVHWAKEDDNVDGNGFDKHYKGTDGYYDVIVLDVGTFVCRYGGPEGQLFAPLGADYNLLGLPYVQETREYHVYLVIAPFEVRRGKVAPMFDSPGGETQYLSNAEETIDMLLDAECLKEDKQWLQSVKEGNSRS